MYSKEIAEYFKKNGIKTGDALKIEYDGVNVEGTLMPTTEAGSPDAIVIKLKNGYNIGVKFENTRITKLDDEERKPASFPKASLKQDGKLPNVSLIYTGGTIGSKVDYKTGGVHILLKPEELFYEVPELSEIAKISATNPFTIWSEDLSYPEWQKLAKEIAGALNSGARGVVVTLGTDTMHYASAALSFMLQDLNAPVVLVGAQRSSDRGSSDAFINLICAAQVAAKSDIAEVGICMHRSSSDNECHFIRGTKARKMHSSRRDAFRPINDTAIAYVTQDGKITYASQYKKMAHTKTKVTAKTDFEEKVALVKVYPNSNPEIIDYYVGKGYKGIIIEGTGLGHAPLSPTTKSHSWLEHIKNAIAKGVIVGMTSQTLYGRVNANVYSTARKLEDIGVIYCEDMLPETAYIKLGWLLGNYDAKKAREMLPKNIAGEINQRTDYDAFLV
ncbi:MAG TPA: Glu-tRNA(Gln) amidotransferase subunit GatD [Candidatus Acidoferrum sp.]|nr:Glu-tRNA(Gln) amidotransferase subunit GatD [Candidatus Acidoferrum sp.]